MASCGPVIQNEGTATTSSAQFAPQRPYRRYLLIVNKGSETIRVKFGSSITGSEGIPIPASGNYEPLHVPTEEIHIIADSGSQTCLVVEG